MLLVSKSCLRPESGLLSLGGSLATKCVLLNNALCMTRPTRLDLNPVEPNYFSFMIILDDECNRSCNVVHADKGDVKVYVNMCSEWKNDLNFKVLNIITRTYAAKTLVKHISCNCKCKFNDPISNSNQKWNNDICQCNVISHSFGKIKNDSYDSLPLEKTLTFHNFILYFKSILNEDQNL